MKLISGAALLVCFLVSGCASKPGTHNSTISSQEVTKRVLDHHWKTFQANDLEGTMADYTEESILITPDKIYKGLSEIRGNFVNAFALFPKDATQMKLNTFVVQQDVAYIIWEATSPTIKLTYGTDTFIIRDGKIIRQTYAG
ncbi:MAG TPA: nuclear transport factor 2 family protein, partial [Chryseolinea sp.]|nr:nuclear transport factor 2 family protein [Chryseolinea sp.]